MRIPSIHLLGITWTGHVGRRAAWFPHGTWLCQSKFLNTPGVRYCEDFARNACRSGSILRLPPGPAGKGGPTAGAAAGPPCTFATFAARLVAECRERLSLLLPLRDSEIEFLNLLLDSGLVDPALLTADADVQQRIRIHPLLEWKALNVRQHKLGMGT